MDNRLYQDMILEHNKSPKNFGKLDKFTHYSRGKNPLCGDDYEIYLKIEDDKILEVGFTGVGCAISKSSASLLTTTIKNKTIAEASKFKDNFINLLTAEDDEYDKDLCRNELGKLKIFEGVKEYPMRVKCATLIWRSFEDAVNNRV
ncbi:MAG: SUF system NifU family Fe-S cluster assembly protein [Candidatus Cloacimonadota bacterium]|nr:MAG: SUF system NifU family Fe-S cluster assembly protein [Candidatus Cloacimonadota bacterium]PIE81427.1 MAG: SUF system NifU family Fe-S cluster assembly protein [Candidatus Delongbacteria bacterium]